MAAKHSQNGSSEAVGAGAGQPEEIQPWTASRARPRGKMWLASTT
jgi:hypothetical protein